MVVFTKLKTSLDNLATKRKKATSEQETLIVWVKWGMELDIWRDRMLLFNKISSERWSRLLGRPCDWWMTAYRTWGSDRLNNCTLYTFFFWVKIIPLLWENSLVGCAFFPLNLSPKYVRVRSSYLVSTCRWTTCFHFVHLHPSLSLHFKCFVPFHETMFLLLATVVQSFHSTFEMAFLPLRYHYIAP